MYLAFLKLENIVSFWSSYKYFHEFAREVFNRKKLIMFSWLVILLYIYIYMSYTQTFSSRIWSFFFQYADRGILSFSSCTQFGILFVYLAEAEDATSHLKRSFLFSFILRTDYFTTRFSSVDFRQPELYFGYWELDLMDLVSCVSHESSLNRCRFLTRSGKCHISKHSIVSMHQQHVVGNWLQPQIVGVHVCLWPQAHKSHVLL